MMSGTELISVLQTGFYVCLAISVLFFIITIIFFFVFKIPLIFDIKTGRAKKRTIEEMKKANSETGRLRSNGRILTSKLDNKRNPKGKNFVNPVSNDNYGVMSYDGSEVTGSLENRTRYSVTTPSPSNQSMPIPAPMPAQSMPVNPMSGHNEYAETSLLSNEEETSLLLGEEETSLLSPEPNSGEAQIFSIIEEIKFLHTNEIIS